MKMERADRAFRGSALMGNHKTGLSLDFSTICPNKQNGHPCPYCYMECRRTLSDLLGFRVACTKLVVEKLPYQDQILRLTDGEVQELNGTGGLRMYSFSDYRESDPLELVYEHALARGLFIKAITKSLDLCRRVAGWYSFRVQVSTDFELAPGLTGEIGPTLSNAPSIAEAHAWYRAYPEQIRVRYMGVNEMDVVTAARDHRVHIVTPYHGYVRDTLEKIIKAQTDPARLAPINGKLGEMLAEWANYDVHSTTMRRRVMQLGGKDLARKQCCITGHCQTCAVRCGYSL